MNTSTDTSSISHSSKLFRAFFRGVFLIVCMIASVGALSANQPILFNFLASGSHQSLEFTHTDTSTIAIHVPVQAVITESEEVNEEHEEQHNNTCFSIDVCLFCIQVAEKPNYLPGLSEEPNTIDTPLYILFHSLKIHLS